MSEIDEFYVLFRAITAPFVEGMVAMTSAAERAAVGVDLAAASMVASTERMGVGATTTAAAMRGMAASGAASYEALAASSAAAAAGMARAQAGVLAANARMEASFVAMEAAATRAALATAKRLAVGALGAGIIAGATVKMAADFETATLRLVTSAGETHEGLEIVRKGILRMTGEVGNSAKELSKAMYIIESGGQHGADGLKVLRAAAEGAAAEGADLYEVADAITSILADYHWAADKAALVTSKMVAAVGAGKTTFQEFSSSLSSILPIASAAHISLDDISAAIASMTVHGMSAQQATQNLADVVRHMVAPTQIQTKELGQLGMSSADLADKLGSKGLTGTLQEISELIISHMGPAGRVLLQALNQSKEAARDSIIMIEAMPKALQGMAHGYQNGEMSLKQWRAAVKALPPEQANLLMQWQSLENRAKGFNDVLKSGSPAAQTYMDAMRRATGDATGLNVALMLTGENTEYVNNTVKKVAAATTEAGNHVAGWAEIQETFNVKMHRAKSALGAVAIEVGEKLLPVATKLFDGLAKGLEWLSKHDTVATALAITLGVLTVGLGVAAAAIWVMNLALLANPLTWIIVVIVAFIAAWVLAFNKISWFHTAVMAYIHFWMNIPGWLRTAWDAVWAFFVGIGRWFRDDFAGFFVHAWNKIKDWTGKAVDWFKELPGRIVSYLKALPGRLEAAAREGMHRLAYAIGYGLGTVYKLWATLPFEVVKWVQKMWAGALHWVADGAVKVWRWFVKLKDDVIETVTSWWHTGVGLVKTGISNTITFVRELPVKVGAFFVDMYHRAVTFTTNMVNGVVAFVRSLPQRAKDAIRELPGKIMDAVSGAGMWLYNAGRDIVSGAINGIKSMVGHAVNAAKSFGGDIVRGFKSAVGIASPSTVFAEAGRNVVAGLVQGIESTSHRAVAAVAGLADAMTLAPSVSIAVGAGAAGGIGVLGPAVGPRYRPPTPRAADERPVEVTAVLHLDGKEVYRAIVPHAQRHKGRNPTTALI